MLVVEHMLGDFQLRRRRVCVQIGHERLENPKGGGGELPRLKLGPVADTIRGTPMELEARSQGGHPRQGGKEAIRGRPMKSEVIKHMQGHSMEALTCRTSARD